MIKIYHWDQNSGYFAGRNDSPAKQTCMKKFKTLILIFLPLHSPGRASQPKIRSGKKLLRENDRPNSSARKKEKKPNRECELDWNDELKTEFQIPAWKFDE